MMNMQTVMEKISLHRDQDTGELMLQVPISSNVLTLKHALVVTGFLRLAVVKKAMMESFVQAVKADIINQVHFNAKSAQNWLSIY